MRKRWKVKEFSEDARRLAQKGAINPHIVQLLLNRGIPPSEFSSFLNPEEFSFPSFALLPDIDKTCRRIQSALRKKEKIFLFGDYDVDGITSLAVLHDAITGLGGQVSFYIPHRVHEGFGLNAEAVRMMARQGAGLIITCDCGTNAYDEVAFARSLSIDCIIIDHHQPKARHPDAFAFINPKRHDSQYPFQFLSSAGVAFKVAQALRREPCAHLLDLVALSIICDVVPLQGENRALLKKGLRLLKRAQRPSVRALCASSGVKPENIEAFHLGFILGPRINASGRVNTAHDALSMFLATDFDTASTYAHKLEEYNRHRRAIESSVLKEAEKAISDEVGDFCPLIVYKQGWHHGVLGIVASRLAEKYCRPAFVIGFDEERGKGSARSVAHFNLMEALSSCDEYLTAYGGHTKAAGIELSYGDIEGFKKRLYEVTKSMINPQDLVPVLDIDLRIGFSDITGDFLEQLQACPPFGEGNPLPLFLTKGVTIKPASQKKRVTRSSVWLVHDSLVYEGLYTERSGLGDILNKADCVDIVYRIEKNHFHNTVRLILKDVRLH